MTDLPLDDRALLLRNLLALLPDLKSTDRFANRFDRFLRPHRQLHLVADFPQDRIAFLHRGVEALLGRGLLASLDGFVLANLSRHNGTFLPRLRRTFLTENLLPDRAANLLQLELANLSDLRDLDVAADLSFHRRTHFVLDRLADLLRNLGAVLGLNLGRDLLAHFSLDLVAQPRRHGRANFLGDVFARRPGYDLGNVDALRADVDLRAGRAVDHLANALNLCLAFFGCRHFGRNFGTLFNRNFSANRILDFPANCIARLVANFFCDRFCHILANRFVPDFFAFSFCDRPATRTNSGIRISGCLSGCCFRFADLASDIATFLDRDGSTRGLGFEPLHIVLDWLANLPWDILAFGSGGPRFVSRLTILSLDSLAISIRYFLAPKLIHFSIS